MVELDDVKGLFQQKRMFAATEELRLGSSGFKRARKEQCPWENYLSAFYILWKKADNFIKKFSKLFKVCKP